MRLGGTLRDDKPYRIPSQLRSPKATADQDRPSVDGEPVPNTTDRVLCGLGIVIGSIRGWSPA